MLLRAEGIIARNLSEAFVPAEYGYFLQPAFSDQFRVFGLTTSKRLPQVARAPFYLKDVISVTIAQYCTRKGSSFAEIRS
jgi:hypothetical protein